MYSFTMTESDFTADVHSEYDQFNISLPDVMELYGRVGPPYHGQPNSTCGCGSPQLAPEVCIPCKRPSKPAYSPWWWSVVERGSDFGFHCTSRAFAAVHSEKHPVFLHSYKVMEEQYPGLFCAAHCTEKAIYSFTGSDAEHQLSFEEEDELQLVSRGTEEEGSVLAEMDVYLYTQYAHTHLITASR